MQEQFSQIKDKMQDTSVEGSAGNGLVTLTLNGSKELKKIAIKPECIDPKDVEGLQDLILAAFEDAASKLDNQNNPGLPAGMPWLK